MQPVNILKIMLVFILLNLMGYYGRILSLRQLVPNQRIVGGIEIDIHHHPYQVTLQNSRVHHCGASIISEKWVVTAGHCFGFPPIIYTIGAGSKHRYKGTFYNVSRIIIHPKYKYYKNDYDIALVEIQGTFNYGPNVNAIKLPDKELCPKETVNVTGWGAVKAGGSDTNNLRRATVRIVDHEQCVTAYKDINLITERMICAGLFKTGGKDSCQGDSGGSLSANDTLYGIVSWGHGCAEPNYPGVYTNVAYFRSWIVNVTGI